MSQIETIGVILGVLVFCGLGVIGLIIANQKPHKGHPSKPKSA